jgi:N-acetylmuramoyl-L-alanine amidase
LCKVFPQIACDYPRDGDGRLVPKKLPVDELNNYRGVLGHFHVQLNKTDPGPAFDWDRVIGGARKLLGLAPVSPAAGHGTRAAGTTPAGE